MNYNDKINESVSFLESKKINKPETGIILGSGLGGLADIIEDAISIKYEDIPHFPVSTVEGHAGRLVFGKLEGMDIVAMQGRFHYYEGYHISDVVFPVRVMIGLGIQNLIVTNAAGGVNKSFEPGDLMIINDHINYSGVNPLIGKNLDSRGPRFVDMTFAYDKELMEIARLSAKNLNLNIKEGVYMWFTGPTYETPAEIKFASMVGADAVGMSTVPEVIVANHEGIKVLGISCITNMASGILDKALNHDEVVETSLMVKDKFQKYVREILKNI
ncbi:MAG: purine-nucleoside phosphorylase [Tissierellaceae bacterium]|nr:purine-nucleoside phosphorylase [Tissierellaceae bacterium]